MVARPRSNAAGTPSAARKLWPSCQRTARELWPGCQRTARQLWPSCQRRGCAAIPRPAQAQIVRAVARAHLAEHETPGVAHSDGRGRLDDHGPLRGGSVLATILDGRKYPENLQLRDTGVRTWLKMVAEQRHKWWAKRRADEDTLDSAFWLYVYENHFDLDRAGIERYFGEHERGPLRELPSDPEIVPGIDMLFGHMAYVNAGPVAKFWYVFWHDVWANNADVAVFEESADVLDPQRPDAWAFAPAPRHELKKMLAERKLDKWFGDKVLDSLYEGIASYSAGNKSGNPMRATAMEIVDPSTAV